MMTLTSTVLTIIPTLDVSAAPLTTERPIVRVLWGRALGSTYQRYFTSSNSAEADRGGSMFSRPLTCPTCGGAFELHQPRGSSPDQLIGRCASCLSSSFLEVGDEGRLTLKPSR